MKRKRTHPPTSPSKAHGLKKDFTPHLQLRIPSLPFYECFTNLPVSLLNEPLNK